MKRKIDVETKQNESKVVGILGMGRFGTALEHSLIEIGWQVSPRNRELQAAVPLQAWLASVEVVCVCVRDDQTPEVLGQLASEEVVGKVILIHAGTLPLDLLTPLADRGATIGKLHPLMSFSSKNSGGIPVGTPFAYEGDIKPLIEPWIRAWGGQLHQVCGDQWQVYHLAAVYAANFLPLFIRAGADLMKTLTDGEKGAALTWLAPLIRHSVEKALDDDIETPFSGPAIRGDQAVIDAQEAFLIQNHSQWASLYRLASQHIQKMSEVPKMNKKT